MRIRERISIGRGAAQAGFTLIEMMISVTLGLIPVTGVPLPFLSFGGSSLVVTMGAFGILLNIARQAR